MDSSLHVLFLSAFLAATVLPMSSEVVLVAVLANDLDRLWLPLGLATVGNTLGSVVNWCLGRFLGRYVGRRWYPLTEERHRRAARWFKRFGVWSLLFAWLPGIGDPLTVVAGLLGVRFRSFLPLVAIGKAARYMAIAMGVHGFS